MILKLPNMGSNMSTYQRNQGFFIFTLIMIIGIFVDLQVIQRVEAWKAFTKRESYAAALTASSPQTSIGVAPIASAPRTSIGVAPSASPPEKSEEIPPANENCTTGNPIDDCWRCSGPHWHQNRKRLVECALRLGIQSIGGKEGDYYVVDSNDDNPAYPQPGTLRYAAMQDQPLWIMFIGDMVIRLKDELTVKSFKTIDGRGADVHITGFGCINIAYASHVIVHGIHVHECKAGGGRHRKTEGDGITIYGSKLVWVDHCSMSNCYDGLIDVTHNSTAITITSNLFTHHDKVMLLGHADDDANEKQLRVTVAYNHFGEGLVQRMPRCRHGYFHVVNNYYSGWGLYAIGGSADPTILSQRNIFFAPQDPSRKEVTSRIGSSKEWMRWNWESDGDLFLNGAFFVSSGTTDLVEYKSAMHLEAKPTSMVPAITKNAGVLKTP